MTTCAPATNRTPKTRSCRCGTMPGPIDNDAKAFGDLRLYEGFLKRLYTEGMLGGVAGYFSYPKGGFDAAFCRTSRLNT